MSGRQMVAATGSTVMLLATVMATALIWVIATDPLFVAALASTGDVITVLSGIAGRVIASLW
jgi:hypothetical protein